MPERHSRTELVVLIVFACWKCIEKGESFGFSEVEVTFGLKLWWMVDMPGIASKAASCSESYDIGLFQTLLFLKEIEFFWIK